MANSDSSDDEGSSSWEWVYYEEEVCLSCPSSAEEDSGEEDGIPKRANRNGPCNSGNDVTDNAEYEYYDEMDASSEENPNVTSYETFRKEPY